MDHLAVAAHVGLHDVGRHDVGQGFLQNVVLPRFRQQAINVEGAHGFHAAQAGALGGGHPCGVHGAEQFRGAEAGVEEGFDGGHEVPDGDPVEVVDHVGGDAVHGGVEAFGDLAADEAGHGHASGDAYRGAGLAGDGPLPCFFVEAGGGGVRFGVHVGFGRGFVGNVEGQVLVQVDGGEFRRQVAHHAEVVVVAAHPHAGEHIVVVAIVDVGLVDGFVVAGVPAVGVPVDEPHGPGEFDHAGGGEVAGEFHVEAGAVGAQRPDLAHADDDDHVVEVLGDLPGEVGGGFRNGPVGGGEGGDGVRLVGVAPGGGLLRLGLPGEFGQVDVALAQAAGGVHHDGVFRSFTTHVLADLFDQQFGDFVGGVGGDPGLLHGRNQGIVAAHEAGAPHPADEHVYQRGVRFPRGFGVPPVDERVQGRLGFPVGAVPAEPAPVGGAGQDHVQAGAHVGAGADGGQAGDEPFHGPQEQPHLHFRGCTSVGEGPGDAGGSEGEQQGGFQGGLDEFRRPVHRGGLLRPDPFDHIIEIGVAGQVGGHDPQGRLAARGFRIELLVEAQPRVVQRRCGDHHRCPAPQQLLDDARRDRVRGGAGHDRDVVGELQWPQVSRLGGQIVQAEVFGLPGNRLTSTGEVQVGGIQFSEGHPGHVFAGGSPPVVQQHGFTRVEARRHLPGPVGPQFPGHQLVQGGIRVRIV